MKFYIKCSSCGSINRVQQREGERPVCGRCKKPLDEESATADEPVPVFDDNFSRDILSAKVPVLVDFFAAWCGACRSLEPSLNAVASRYKGRLKVAKLDVERNPENAGKYRIRATPTLILFQEGKPSEQVEGSLPEEQLDHLVRRYI